MEKKHSAKKAVREIRRKTRRRLSAEEKVRLAVTRLPAQPARDLEPTPDRRTAMARATLDRPLWLASDNPAQNLKNLPHPDLPVRHLRCLLGSQDWLTRSLGVGSRS